MTKDQLWKIYTDKNPSFLKAGGQVTMSTEGLKKFFDQAFEQGYECGKVIAKTMQDNMKSTAEHYPEPMQEFEAIFGKQTPH